MSTSMDKLAKELRKQMSASEARKPSPYDAQAEVLRVEGDTAWVHIPGGVEETPVQLSIDATEGDYVNIRVANGSAWITGNTTRPPTDDTEANVAKEVAVQAVEVGGKALEEAQRATEGADRAEEEAERAHTAANQAETLANYIDKTTYGTITYRYDNDGSIETVYKRDDGTYYWIDDIEETHDVEESDLVHDGEDLITDRQADGLDATVEKARQDARDANDAALSATDSANNALLQLSEVEKVVDVLTWVAEHGQYTLTKDTEVQPGKYYFMAEFSLTTDTAIDSTKTYYSEVDGEYTIVEEPDVLDIGSYYEGTFDVKHDPSATTGLYEISSVKEAVSNYIATHLALTDSGLYVQMDNDAYKLQIASDGIHLWDGNKIIATYSSSVTLGDTESMHMVLSAGILSFYDGDDEVAYISTNTLSITSAEIKNDLRIGNFIWKPRDGRLTLMYSPIV